MTGRGLLIVALVGLAIAAVGPSCWAGAYHLMVTNDDGVDAPGIAALVAACAADESYRITVVAPATHQSGMGHAVSFHGEIQAQQHEPLSEAPTWAVSGTPATAVRIGLGGLLADDPPDLVLSGINRGENVGRIAWYSGTVGAAREAVLDGVPAIAFSLQLDWDDPQPDFDAAARLAKAVVDAVREHDLPTGALLNVNIPRDPARARGYQLTRMGLAADAENGVELIREDESSRWFGFRWRANEVDDPGTDNNALCEGWVSVAPLGLDQTAFTALAPLADLNLFASHGNSMSRGAKVLTWVLPVALIALIVVLAAVKVRARAS
jgi:5'-nucleotidase